MFPHILSFIKENVSTKDMVMTGSITLSFIIKMPRACKQFNTPTRGNFFPYLVSEECVFNALV